MGGEKSGATVGGENLKEKFPVNYSVMLTGPLGIGKYDYCLDLVKYYLKKGENVIYITTKRSPAQIKEKMKSAGFDLEKYEAKKFVFIDIFSSDLKYDKGFYVDNPANLNLIGIRLTNAVQLLGKPVRIFFDSLSTLFLHASMPDIRKFFGVLVSRAKIEYGFILFTLHEGMHDEQTAIALETMVDCVIEMKFEKGTMKRKFRVQRANGISTTTAWNTFEITNKGFEFAREEILKPVTSAGEATGRTINPKIKIAVAVAILIIELIYIATSGLKYISPMLKDEGNEAPVKITEVYSMRINESSFIEIKNRIDSKAPNKGWLVIENPFYRIDLNLDHPYYLLFDKINNKNLLVFNNTVKQKHEILTGSTLGYADLDGGNAVSFSSMALDDDTGIEYRIVLEDKEKGFLLLDTAGWDFKPASVAKDGYDVEGEEMLAIFADKPYFIDAVEISNLQKLGYAAPIRFRDPTEIVKDWVLIGEYDSGVIKGGDRQHLNKELWEPFYEVQTLRKIRKPWHAGSAEISKMFPIHVLVGSKMDGGIIFSLPEGRSRFDDTLGVYGAQLAGEFLISVDEPEKALAFSVDLVNREEFLYDVRDYNTVSGYAESVKEICRRYNLNCSDGVIDAREWKVKRVAYVITLTKNWYNPATNKPHDRIWVQADEALMHFKNYEEIIWKQMEATKPLVPEMVVR